MTKTLKRRTKDKLITLTALLLLVLIVINKGTFSRYQGTYTPNTSLTVARWAIAFKTEDNVISESNKITFKVPQTNNIAANRIAPNTTAVAEAVVDLTGTEVSVDLDVSINSSDIQAAFPSVDTSRVTYSLKVNNVVQNTATISYSTIATNPEIPIEIDLTWSNVDTTAGITADSNIGSGNNLVKQIPVTITARQHIDSV